MLKSNLSVLMAERGLKIVDLYNATGISKNTLMSLAENTSKGVQFETVDKLCNYLGVTPAEFFIYAPYMFKYRIEHDKKKEREHNPIAPIYYGQLVIETEQGAKNKLYKFDFMCGDAEEYKVFFPGMFADNYPFDFHIDFIDDYLEEEHNFARLLESAPIQIEREVISKGIETAVNNVNWSKMSKKEKIIIEIEFVFTNSRDDDFTKIIQYTPDKNELTIIK